MPALSSIMTGNSIASPDHTGDTASGERGNDRDSIQVNY
jgi:hypothetical protein